MPDIKQTIRPLSITPLLRVLLLCYCKIAVNSEQPVIPLVCPVSYCQCPAPILAGLNFITFQCSVNETEARFMYNPRESALHPLNEDALNPHLLQSFSGLQSLNLSGLRLTQIADNLFEGLDNLQMVFLNNNNLTILPATLWKNKHQVWAIHVDNNQLEHLSLHFLPEPTRLKRIFANGNHIRLTDEVFSNFTKLEWLHLGRNHIKQLPAHLLHSLKLLNEFDARSNNITEIPDNFFVNSRHLTEVYLGNNLLASLPNTFSVGLVSVRELHLDNNKLERITNDVFQQLGRLRFLFLSNNRIRVIQPHALEPLVRLEVLDLSYNLLDFKNNVPIVKEALLLLNLSHNNITTLSDKTWNLYPCLGDLDLSYNHIEFLQISWLSFIYLCNKKKSALRYYNKYKNRTATHTEIQLQNNEIALIDIQHTSAFNNDTLPTSILIGNNPINCNCESASLVMFLQTQHEGQNTTSFNLIDDELVCDKPPTLKNKKVATIHNALSTCNSDQCPSGCKCFAHPQALGFTVQCTAATMEEIPPSPDYNTSVLDMNYNPLANASGIQKWRSLVSLHLKGALRAQTMKHLTKDLLPLGNLVALKELVMSSNDIDSIDVNLFEDLAQLVHLDLSRNKLKVLVQGTLSNLSNLEILYLDHNNLGVLADQLFEQTMKLRFLELSQNYLHSIGSALSKTCQLRKLYLEHNYLTYISKNAICYANIENISLSHNHISTLNFTRQHDLKLKKLDVSFNNLTIFNVSDVDLLQSGTIINLENNKIKSFLIPPEALTASNNISIPVLIQLNSNPAWCNCKMHSFIEYFRNRSSITTTPQIEFVVDNLICEGPLFLKGRKVQTLDANEVRCKVRECPSLPSCKCFTSTDSYHMLECEGMPDSVPSNTHHLTLTGGNFESLDKLHLPQWANLTKLKFSRLRGAATTLQTAVFQNLTSLKILSIVRSPLLHTDQKWFQNLRFLTELDLSNDEINVLSSTTFIGTENIEKLNLSNNIISELPDVVLHNFVCLASLDLSHNQIQTITSAFLLTGMHLTELKLNHNNIASIEYNAFAICQKLLFLDLSRNILGVNEVEHLPSNIKKLYLSQNPINKISKRWYTLGNLQIIDLSFTRLETVMLDDLAKFPAESTIYLQNASISQIVWFNTSTISRWITTSSTKTKIVLDNNSINCDCHVEPLAKFLKPSNAKPLNLSVEIQAENLQCSKPDNLRGTLVSLVEVQDLYCTLQTCPKNCNCIFIAEKYQNIINCTNSDVASVSLDYSYPIQILILDNIKLHSVQELFEAKWDNLSDLSLRNVSDIGNQTALIGEILLNKTELEALDISYNSISLLPENSFRTVRKLQNLVLSSNHLHEIVNSTFDNLQQLQHLDLSFNRLLNFSETTFLKLTSLRELDLAHNRISFFSQTFFPPDSHLLVLNLSHNNFLFLPPNISFQGLTELQVLDWSNNNLRMPPKSPPILPLSLTHLNFSKNKLAHIGFQNWTKMHNLKLLDLSNNFIESLNITDLLFGNNSVITVNLDRNPRLFKYSFFVPHQWNGTKYWKQHLTLRIDETKFSCECQFQSYKNETELKYGNNSIFIIVQVAQPCLDKYNKAFCSITEPCFPGCSCYKQTMTNFTVMNCTGANMKQMPTKSPRGVNALIADHNFLKELNGLDNEMWTHMTRLSLRFNQLETLGKISRLKMLQHVKLDNNRLARPSGWLLDMIHNSSLPFNLTLGKNPWLCNCETNATKFQNWLLGNIKRIEDINDMVCSGSNKPVLKVQLCPHQWYALIGGIVAILAMLTASLVIVVLYFRHKAVVHMWLYAHGLCVSEDEVDEDKQYDAFISYSSEDTEFVFETLAPTLENFPPFYKLCIHERDWHVGEQILDQIALSVENSRRIIFVLSKNFVQSMWSGLEFQVAHHQSLKDCVNRIIIIVLGEIPPNESLDPNLRMHIGMNTYLKWDDPLFSKKLRYAMPHKCTEKEKLKFENQGLELSQFNT